MRDAEAQLIHDLRNAATVLRAAAAQLQEDDETPARVAEQLVEIIGRRSDMVLTLLEELSVLHERQWQESLGVEAGEASQRVPLADVCRETLAERHPPAGTAVTLDVPDDAVAVGEPMRVVRILDNLLTNAFRYGGRRVTVAARRDGSFIRLGVHDDGPGVPVDIAESVFDAHVRGPESERLGGSGLGLAIVRELCGSMGGSVSYLDRDGASFIVVLPAAPDAAPGGTKDGVSGVSSWEPHPADRVAGIAPVGAKESVDWGTRLSEGRRTCVA